MRKLKFRAWHKEQKKMIEVKYINFTSKYINFNKRATVRFADVELLQYTGFKDKNGKEIYEGDIVQRFRGICVYFPRIKLVEWISTRYKTGFSIAHGKNCEIIGNIYETPEKLEQTE